ncbi:MAG TPA: DUF763 domain-containing protein [Candidatus Pacearchaeota archaeon]|nr:DUF763 domain-containing protein [Candidatus Parcubacteria bacterium]HOU45955.1 DUF763 domain-containing protein [Candidatus Pacearchaeota archaeon]HQI74646.1 DUF763 domain-containing protein [Candidatus Pacearchaeota archaeon]
MIQKGLAEFTLDYGKCPPWLFERMTKLGSEMTKAIISQYGPEEFIKRISDPVWFQSLGTVLAFDWNASGLTTILTASLKEAIRGQEKDLGIFICGGKGKTSKKTPDEIMNWGGKLSLPENSVNKLVYNSKMSAKVDSAMIQDDYQIYHHAFFFSEKGAWSVVQQGMNIKSQSARRYHWYSDKISDLICEPHSGISSQVMHEALNLTAQESGKNRQLSAEFVNGSYLELMKDIRIMRRHCSPQVMTLGIETSKNGQMSFLKLGDNSTDFYSHNIENQDFSKSKYLEKILYYLCQEKPENYEKLLSKPGVGPKTLRALSLVAELIYGAKPSYKDPTRYSFAHGGKDDIPFPVDLKTYDQTINFFEDIVGKTKIPILEKDKILKRIKNKN